LFLLLGGAAFGWRSGLPLRLTAYFSARSFWVAQLLGGAAFGWRSFWVAQPLGGAAFGWRSFGVAQRFTAAIDGLFQRRL
jgi:hypothetical protein